MRSALALSLLLLGVGCASCKDPPARPEVRAEPDAGASIDPCAIAIATAAKLPPPANAPTLPYGRCFGSKKGAWALGAEASSWVAIHVDASGKVARRARAFTATRDNTDPDGPSVPEFGFIDQAWAEAYDFDGDGDVELFVGLHGIWSSHTGLEVAESILFTHKSGAIVKYAPAASFAIWKLEDRDGDGRPDIVTSSPYASSHGGSTPVFSPMLVAHSLADGSFSTTDAVAERGARAACPKKPALGTFRLSGSPKFDDERIGCARLWGVSVDAIAKDLKLDTTKRDDWPAVLDVTPPITLR